VQDKIEQAGLMRSHPGKIFQIDKIFWETKQAS
jgi:hypothetical protein